MSLYLVEIEQRTTLHYYVEADSHDEAEEMAKEIPTDDFEGSEFDEDISVGHKPATGDELPEGEPVWRGGESGGWS